MPNTYVLNLVINGLPSILYVSETQRLLKFCEVLNLVINGLPSIQLTKSYLRRCGTPSFKPCYKWITFNTKELI